MLGAAAIYAANALLKVATATWGGALLDGVPRRVALAGLGFGGAAVMAMAALFPNIGVALLAAALLGACRTAFLGVQAALLGEAVPAECAARSSPSAGRSTRSPRSSASSAARRSRSRSACGRRC